MVLPYWPKELYFASPYVYPSLFLFAYTLAIWATQLYKNRADQPTSDRDVEARASLLDGQRNGDQGAESSTPANEESLSGDQGFYRDDLLQGEPALNKLTLLLHVIVTASFVIDGILQCLRALVDGQWTSSNLAFYDVCACFSWCLSLYVLFREKQRKGYWSLKQYMFWWIAAVVEINILENWVHALITGGTKSSDVDAWDWLLFAVFVVRAASSLVLAGLSLASYWSIYPMQREDAAQALKSSSGSSYGTFKPDTTAEVGSGPTRGSGARESTWRSFFTKLKRLYPFIWPRKDKRLQVVIILCFGLLIAGRIVNVLVPWQLKRVIDSLSMKSTDSADKDTGGYQVHFAWGHILLYILFRFLQGGVGLIQSAQNYLWIPIGQYTTREINVKMFQHLHNLSLQFHINRKTGEVLRVMDRGSNSIIQLLSQITFQILPTLVDIVVAVVFFVIVFGWQFGVIVFTTMALYIFITVRITEWRTKFRRDMIELDNDCRTKAVDSLLNFETVKYYSAEEFEVNRYRDAIDKYQVADFKSSSSLNMLNLAQNAVITLGLLFGSLLCAYKVASGALVVSDFVAFITYIVQLYGPLNFFGTYYRMIQSNFVDMEKLLDLFKQEQSVKDKENAPALVVTDGAVVFEDVHFSYDPRQEALKGISFSIPKNQTVALVGPSGGGKSTILRLLFRFYDAQSGRILIDGQDVKDVTQASVRKNIGVVPQDTVLFNDTIMYNIRYGKPSSSDEEVTAVAKAAQIHDRILSFPDGYDTKVGERGLRLSGGEKQRVAIARTMLKDPPIILLDEATSALDTTTERQIQNALATMTQHRTTLVIAHRLSTIVNADLILVIKDGQVVESGTHNELLQQYGNEGVYYEMWQKQLKEDTEKLSQPEEGESETDQASEDVKKTGKDRSPPMAYSSEVPDASLSRSNNATPSPLPKKSDGR